MSAMYSRRSCLELLEFLELFEPFEAVFNPLMTPYAPHEYQPLIADNYARIVLESYSDRIFPRVTRPWNRTMLIPEYDRFALLRLKLRFES